MEWLGSYISQGVYTVSGPFHPFGGAVDIIVVQQQDGSFKSSPWYVKFGKFQGVLKTKEKIVKISVNGVEADFHMYLNHKGEAYFLKEVDAEGEDSLILSSSSSDETEDQSRNGTIKKSKSCDFDANEKNSVTQVDLGSRKIVARTNSRRSRIFGLMFGRKSMKEDSRQGEGDGAGVERASSLERAEIAADLLEVKWSTNLPTGRSRRDNASRLSASNMLTKEADKDAEGNDEKGPASLLVHDSVDNSFDCPILQEETSPCGGEIGKSYGSGIRETNCSKEISPTARCLRSQEQDTEISTLEARVLEEMHVGIPETSTEIKEFDVGNDGIDERENSSVSEIITPCVQNQSLKLEGEPYMQYDIEQGVGLLNDGVSEKESGTFFIYCETSDRLRVGLDGSGEQGLETLNFSHAECEEAQVHAEFLCESMELISEVNSQPKCGAIMTKKDLNDLRLLSDGDSCQFFNTETIRERSSASADTKSIIMESQSTFDICLTTSDSVKAEILEVINRETITESLTQGKSMDFSYSCTPDCSEVDVEKPPTTPVSNVQMVSANGILSLVEEAESHGICISSSLSNSLHLVQEEENLGAESNMDNLLPSLDFGGDPQRSGTDYLPTKVTDSNIPPSESSEENQFHFSDIDDYVPSGVQCKGSISPDSLETENHPLVTQDEIEDMHQSNDMNYEPSSSPVKLVPKCYPNAFEPLIEESRTTSSPISIPTRRKGAVKEVGRMIESLPNFRSHIDSMEMSDVLHPLSHSLDLDSENLKWSSRRKDVSSSLKSDSDTEHQLVKEHPTVEDARSFKELKNMSTNVAVEISLCRHLLYEGMGAEAASQAFDAEKLDLEKFVSLGPALVKNDKLVIRIGGCYLPWDAAAPIILGMVSFGCEQILEPEGKIVVDRVEKTSEGTSRAIVPSSGSWRLWPFTFQRSRTMNSVQPAPDGTRGSDAENASESTSDITGDKNAHKVKVAKKKVKVIIPTSEQLVTLNLKEGQNVITFTFSTAMLGKQQVDARIYLWKWNTRIVVSDVDGTITKSDVLGQFMPLVGKDWSQTGVAHLFSAIKDNGYQLLFLSARAISQAYLTRQFLFNLKQDGKALPDGPVVISPDGLFPSLFREVIRRAPHEFKIACLKDIRALFPPDCNPFYAGFGNRYTDEISYLKVGIPKGKIFIINTKGEVAVNRWIDRKSYTSLHALVNGMFPAMSSAGQEEFNSWNYWRVPLPDINT